MGCASSKRIEVTTDVYRPPPTSFSVFDIYTIEEPWLKANDTAHQQDDEKEKPAHDVVQDFPVLDKLIAIEDASRTWEEVSKALEDLKPALQKQRTATAPAPKPPITKIEPPAAVEDGGARDKQPPRKSSSFHTLEELDAKLSSPKPQGSEVRKTELKKNESSKLEVKKIQSVMAKPNNETDISRPVAVSGTIVNGSYKPLRENIFILKDRLEREKEGKSGKIVNRFDPLNDYPEKSPPGGADSVVIYTTSLGGVRRTFEDCNKVRSILEFHRVAFDERDISLHGEFLNELKELLAEELGEAVPVPRMFVKGRYMGGVEEVVNLNETSRLRMILNWGRVERGPGRLGCEGCGGARFVPCLDCGGSCKVLIEDEKQRCPECNENGLIHCPVCA